LNARARRRDEFSRSVVSTRADDSSFPSQLDPGAISPLIGPFCARRYCFYSRASLAGRHSSTR
jgi:hypothetical protein